MNKYVNKYKKELKRTYSQKEAVLRWIKKLENNELKDEVANYGFFSRIILEDILGYDYGENIRGNDKEEHGRGFSDFAIYKNNKKLMVIELKGQDADLDKPQNRKNDKRTPVDQAFGYLEHSKEDVVWIFVSNYKEFRLYNYKKRQHNYISFKAEELVDPEIFKQFLLIFSKFSLLDHNLIEKLLNKTQFVERDLESEFYKLYNQTRLMLVAELEHLHPEVTREKSVHYSQIILNRYIFICFAEDLGLLPEQISVETIEKAVKNQNLRGSEIWHDLNGLFIDVDKGNEFREEKIYGYNGGLFSEDIEFLKIRDIVEDQSIFKDAYQQKWKFQEYSLIVEEKLSPYGDKINPIYKNLMTISTFNFSSELDVNILGHIFENSIGDIEELKADQKGRRKKDGIFYTPEYITDYICRNTIIPYLSKSGDANTVEKLISEYWGSEINQLDENVRKIKIVDPACGSGAFLNKASDVLLEIHERIHEIQYKDDSSLDPYFDSIKERKNILLNNIYGVDLNEESVEITKLALFLKICKKGLKLPNLDKNIKCGNSIVDDPEYAGEKAFSWEKEFEEIFKDNGFDVVIGNPPYVRQEKFKEIKTYLKKNYMSYTGIADLYVYFFEKGLNILRERGLLGFICSNKFIKANYGKNLRKFILENSNFKKYNDHSFDNIFEDATTYPSIFIFEKGIPDSENKILFDNEFEIEQSKLDVNCWVFQNPDVLNLKEKIERSGIRLKDIDGIDIYYGIKTGYNKAFIINEQTKKTLIEEDPANQNIIKPLLRGRDLKKWKIEFDNNYLLFIPWNFHINEYISLKNYLTTFKDDLKKRSVVANGTIKWFELSSYGSTYYKKFEQPKLVYPVIAPQLLAIYDENGFYINDKCFMVTSTDLDLKFLNALLSSKLLNFIFKFLSSSLQGKYYELRKIFVEQLPIYPATFEEQIPLIEKADLMLQKNKELQEEINGFKGWLQYKFNIEKFSKNLDKFYELTFDEFLLELKKKKVDTKPKTHKLLKKEFNTVLDRINPLIQEIKKTDEEINQMVYELYGLNENEIRILENSLK